MCPRAAPSPLSRFAGQPGPDRVLLNVARGSHQMALIHWVRCESALPEVSSPALPFVDAASVAPVGVPDGSAEVGICPRYCYQVHVVWHQAIGPDADAVQSAGLCHNGLIGGEVPLIEECPLSPVPALHDVMWDPADHHPSYPSHAQIVSATQVSWQVENAGRGSRRRVRFAGRCATWPPAHPVICLKDAPIRGAFGTGGEFSIVSPKLWGSLVLCPRN
jgi:hypothetical protein